MFGICRPACHDYSLYLFVLVIFLEAVVLSQAHIALNIFYQHIVHVYRGVVYNHHLCLCDVRLNTHFLLSSDSCCSICCSSCCVSVHRNMSSAKRRLERNYQSIFRPLPSQFNLLNMLSNVAVNNVGDMLSPCVTPLLILIFPLSLCSCTVTELSIYMSFMISMYTSSIHSSCNDVNIVWVCTESNASS